MYGKRRDANNQEVVYISLRVPMQEGYERWSCCRRSEPEMLKLELNQLCDEECQRWKTNSQWTDLIYETRYGEVFEGSLRLGY